MKIQLAKRVELLLPSATLAITAKARQLRAEGVDVISFGAGEPDFNTPDHIIEAAYTAMQQGKTRYTPAAGIPELKKAIVNTLKKDYNLSYNLDQIIVTSGAKQALYNFFQVILDPGDEVIVPTPYWVSYPEQVKLASGTPILVEGKEEQGYKITVAQLKEAITPRTKAVIINSPSNPTGAIYTKEELLEIGKVACDHDLLIVSDEIYEKLIYEGSHVSMATLSEELYERTLVVNGVSKPYAMTGWRIGYAAGNKELIKAMTDLSSHSTSNPTTISQYAAIAAFEGDQSILETMRSAFQERRNRVFALLSEIPGFKPFKPQGAFYVYINITEAMGKAGIANVDEWAKMLLDEANVAVIPGTGFGTDQHIRISFATSMEELERGIERIRHFVERTS